MKTFDTIADSIEFSLLWEDVGGNIIKPAAKLADMSKEEVSKAISALDVDKILDLIDAVNTEDEAKVLMILSRGQHMAEDEKSSKEETDVEDEDEDEDEIDSDLAPDSQHGLLPADLEESLSVGQTVKANKKDGIVKITDGPGDTVGVLIDGEIQMVEKRKVKRVDETVLGMTAMPGLKRMQELAGIMAGVEPQPAVQNAEQVVTTGPIALPSAEEVEQTKDAENAVETEVVEDDVENDGAENDDVENDDAEIETQDEECENDECEGADRPHEIATSDPEADIMSAIETIEKNIRNIKVGSFKNINDRLSAIQQAVFESAIINRKPL